MLPDLLEGFHREFPGISISLHQGKSDDISRDVQQQKADFAIASGQSELFEDLITFRMAGIKPNVVFTAEDPDVIKTYVRKGMGVGIVASMAWDASSDKGLVAISAAHLFPMCTTWIGFHKDRFLCDYMYTFLELMVPGTDREAIDRIIAVAAQQPQQSANEARAPSQAAVLSNRSGTCRPHSRVNPKNRVSCSSIPAVSGRLL